MQGFFYFATIIIMTLRVLIFYSIKQIKYKLYYNILYKYNLKKAHVVLNFK